MKDTTIAFIGGGNMAHSLIAGLLKDGYPVDKIWVSEPDSKKAQDLANRYSINVTMLNEHAVADAQVVILAVKPQHMQQVTQDIADKVSAKKPLIISIAAGIAITTLQNWLDKDTAIIRCMPNTPAMVGSGATALYANAVTTEAQRQTAESILRSVGLTVWLTDEEQMNAVTALSGSGPAYFFLVMEALQQAAEQEGLTSQQARLLTVQTALGAARLALETAQPIAELRCNVTSPGGTTAQGIQVLQAGKLEELFSKALQAAKQRAIALSQEFV